MLAKLELTRNKQIIINMLQDKLNFYKDFPKEGINFIDIMPFLYSKDVFREVISELDVLVDTPNLAVPEARGFLFGTPLLMTDGAVSNVIPVRKSGKLPFSEGDLVGVEIIRSMVLTSFSIAKATLRPAR